MHQKAALFVATKQENKTEIVGRFLVVIDLVVVTGSDGATFRCVVLLMTRVRSRVREQREEGGRWHLMTCNCLRSNCDAKLRTTQTFDDVARNAHIDRWF